MFIRRLGTVLAPALQQPTYTLKASPYNELSSSPDHGSVDMDNSPLS